jgi:hypothetical protein
MIKKMVVSILALCLLTCGIAMAADDEKPLDTIVGADQLMNNRFQYVDPQDKDLKRPDEVQKLLDKGIFTAAEDARNAQTAPSVKTK